MAAMELVLRTATRNLCRHLPHVPVKTRVVIATSLCIGGLVGYWITEHEVYYKVFEFSSAPFIDLILFKLGITDLESL